MHTVTPTLLTLIACTLLSNSLIAAPSEELLKLGAESYAACATCHGTDGKGLKAGEAVMAPSLHDSAYVKSASAEALTLIVLKGIKKEEGSPYLQQMIALDAALNDEKLAAVITHVRNSYGGHSDSVKAKQIKEWRQKYASTPAPVTHAQLPLIEETNAITLTDLKFRTFQERLEKLPDFDLLEPVASGKVDSNIIDLNVASEEVRKKAFGLVFEGTLTVPKTRDYELSLNSDDGSRLIIDGETEILHDGVHAATTKTAVIPLEEGTHTIRVDYFDIGGHESLAVGLRPKDAPLIAALSRTTFGDTNGSAKKEDTPIPITPTDEAIIYRNFVEGSQPRGIAVGYPQGVHLCWDADTYNLALLWRGEFMNAARHWNGRGVGNQPPSSEDVVKPALGMSLQILESPETQWVDYSVAKIAYDRDQPETDRLVTYNKPHSDFRFKGYSLDEKRFPTFRYTFHDLTVTDFFAPQDGKSITRTLTFAGTPPPHTHLRLGRGGELKPDGIYDHGTYTIAVENAKVSNGNYVIPITPETKTLTVTYSWK